MPIIAIDAREFKKGKMTGIGRFLKNFILAAVRWKKEFNFILLGDSKTEIPFELPENFRFLDLGPFFNRFTEQFLLPLVLKKEKANLFFSPYYKKPFLAGIPCVVTVHDLIPLIYPESFFEKYFLKGFLKRYLSGCQIITDSENSKKDISEFLKIPEAGIKVVYGFPALSFVPSPVRGNRHENLYKLGIKKPYLLYVGNANPHKNLKTLLEAYKLLSPELREKYNLVLAGAGNAVEPGAGEKEAVFLNGLDDRELACLYSEAELFVFPSLYEGFGFPPLEAMACGCPVLSSASACLPEILGEAAEYFNPLNPAELSEKIKMLLSFPERRRILSEKGLSRAALYTEDKFYLNLTKVLREGLE